MDMKQITNLLHLMDMKQITNLLHISVTVLGYWTCGW